MAKIKLFKKDIIEGTVRLQSQLSLGKDSVDFILQDGKLKNWRYEEGCTGFYETDVEYEIVEDVSEMKSQQLN